MKKCLECGNVVANYRQYFCEECWEKFMEGEEKDGEDSSRHRRGNS